MQKLSKKTVSYLRKCFRFISKTALYIKNKILFECKVSFIKGIFSFRAEAGPSPGIVIVWWEKSVIRRRKPLDPVPKSRVLRKYFNHELLKRLPAGGVIICSAYIFPKYPAVVTAGGVLIAEASRRLGQELFHNNIFSLRSCSAEKELEEAFLLHNHYASNIYHWVFEVLPFFSVPEFRQLIINQSTSVLLPPLTQSYQKESLALLGLEKASFVFTNNYSCLFARKAILPVLPSGSGDHHPDIIRHLREVFLPRTPFPASESSRYIYISRAKASRSVSNEEEIFGVLKKVGFKKVFLEELSFSSQVSVFKAADIVVAPHGAGLAHIVFMREGASVVELMSKDYINTCYWRLACACSVNYTIVLGKPVYQRAYPEGDDYIINVQDVSKALRQHGVRFPPGS